MAAPPQSIPQAEIEQATRLYHEGVAVGCVPMGGHVGVGKTSALAHIERAAGWSRAGTRRRVEVACRQGLIDAPTRMAALRGDVGGPPIPPIAKPAEGFEISRNSGAYDADGTLLRQWVGSKQSPGEVFEIPAGHVVKGESVLLDQSGRVTQRWVKTREGAGEGLIEGLKAAFAEYEGKAPAIPEPDAADDDLLTEYPVPDLHLGAYSWGKETGENYDTDIAVDVATRSIQTLVAQSRPSTHAVLIFMGDYTHANDEKAVTPASGHRLDTDGRWHRVYAAAAKLAVSMVDIVARKHRFVSVRVLRGNHDPDAAVCLAVALSLFYSGTARITIEEDPSISWYRRFGRCLLGATHGHTQKPEAMAMSMAVDRAADWGETVHRHIAFGHIHHVTAKEIMGVRVESFQAMAARDAYNAEHGYRAGRSMSALTWHRDMGEIGRHRVNISGGGGLAA